MFQRYGATAGPADAVAVLDGLIEAIRTNPRALDAGAAEGGLCPELQDIVDAAIRGRADLSADTLDRIVRALAELADKRFSAGDVAAALSLDRWALSVRRLVIKAAPAATAAALRRVARDYYQLGDYVSAADFAEQALAMMETAIGTHDQAPVPFVVGLASAYEQLGRLEEARSAAERALALAEACFGSTDLHASEALQTLASIHRKLGRVREAYEFAERAFDIERRTRGVESFEAARVGGQVAGIVAQIGDRPLARTMLETALKSLQKLPPNHANSNEIATILANLAGLSEDDQALGLYKEAIALRRSACGPDHPETIRVLSHLALLHCRRGQEMRALAIWDECLDRRRRLHGPFHPDVARSLIDVAYPLLRLGDVSRAKRALLESIAVLSCYDMPTVGARADSLLASIVSKSCLAAGIFFAKQIVNTFQDLRADANLRDDVDRAFVAARENSYRQLGDSLIVGGRLPEAQQAISMLKEVELFDIALAELEPRVTRAALTPLEKYWAERRDEILKGIKTQCTTGLVKDERAELDPGEVRKLQQVLARGTDELDEWLGTLQAVLADGDAERGRVRAMTSSIAPRPGVAFLQYLMASDRLQIVLTTSNESRSYESRFARGQLHRLVYDVRVGIQEQSGDFLASAQQLYDLVIAPAAADIRAAEVGTLALSLDSVLRYVPMAALHDGARYLVEDYALAIAAGEQADGARGYPTSDWRGCGLGVTKPIPPHDALVGVRNELAAVIRSADGDPGIVPGIIRLDEAFTAQAMDEALSAGFHVIHIASHFAFRAAQEASSYLLLGDGTKLTLADLARRDFAGIYLVVLSACDTATGAGHAHSGREIEGLGALVRHRGARNVVATLWPVHDFTTAIVMRQLYDNHFRRGLPLAEALRQAQLALWKTRSDPAAAPGPRRALVPPREERDNAGDSAPWSHPRYWAPYLLMGEAG